MSPWQAKMLNQAEHWYIDATFYVVPARFRQLLVIQTYDSDSDFYLPCCFVLCSHKTKDIYDLIFEQIRKELNVKIQRITVDFEKGLYNSLKDVFGEEITLIGCKYHLISALIRKAKKQGLGNKISLPFINTFIEDLNNALILGKDLNKLIEESVSANKKILSDNNISNGLFISNFF